MLLCCRQNLVLFCCPHLMLERIINRPVTGNTFVESWFARFGDCRFPRALPTTNGLLGIQVHCKVTVGILSDSVAGPLPNPDPPQAAGRQGKE